MIEMIKHFFPCKIHRSNKSHLFHFIWHGTPMRNVQLPLREQSSVHVCLSFWKGPEALTKLESPPRLYSPFCSVLAAHPSTFVPSFFSFSEEQKGTLVYTKNFRIIERKNVLKFREKFCKAF